MLGVVLALGGAMIAGLGRTAVADRAASLDEAKQLSVERDLPILIDFGTEW